MSLRGYTAGEVGRLPGLVEIREWACSVAPNESVGRTCSSYDCPLAHALEALRKGLWDVDGKHLWNFTKREKFVTPVAYARLAAKVDALDGSTYPGIWLHRPVTAARFVALIDAVIAEQKSDETVQTQQGEAE
jgi:hypothetical protein